MAFIGKACILKYPSTVTARLTSQSGSSTVLIHTYGGLWVEFMASGFREFIDGGVSRPAPSTTSGTAKHCGQPNSNQNCETHRCPFLPPRKWTMYSRALSRNRPANNIINSKLETGHPGKLNIRTNGLEIIGYAYTLNPKPT